MELLIGLGLLAILGLWWLRTRQRPPACEDIRRRIAAGLRMPPELAESVIDDYLSRLRKKHPGRSDQWYLEKAEYDLVGREW